MFKRILVCGGRDFADRAFLVQSLNALLLKHPTIDTVIEGGARGADTFGGEWANSQGLTRLTFRADWDRHGKAAGAIRNTQMLVDGAPDLVVAFPGGSGTANMKKQALAAGISVLEAPVPSAALPVRTGSKVSLDFESRSRVDIKKRGSYPYFECADFRPLMAAYRIDGGDIQMWLPNARGDCPYDLRAAIVCGTEIHGWNVAFEAQCLDWLHHHWGWPAYRPEQLVDTAAAAAALGLPRSLGEAAKVMGMADQKDTDGTRLINLFCKPNRKGVFNKAADHPEDWALFQEYCRQDVRTEEALSAKVPALSARERQIWALNLKINRRGVRVDVNAAIGALKIVDIELARLDAEMRIATAGAVTKCTQIKRIKEWAAKCDTTIESLNKSSLSELLDSPDTPADVRAALLARQEAGKTSVAALKAMVRRSSADGRVRGTALYHGASTGRDTATGLNTKNLPRPSRHWEDTKLDKAALFRAFRNSDVSLLPSWPGGSLQLISDSVRSFILAAPGKFIVQADFSSIEGIFAAWLTGETWKVEAYREISLNPKLPDIYRRTAARLLGTTTDEIHKKHPMRQSLGKLSELASQYGGGVGAYYKSAKQNGIDLDKLYAPLAASASDENALKATRRYARCVKRGQHKSDVMSREAWLACELAKLMWRADNPAICASWKLFEDAIRQAVEEPGTQHAALGIRYKVAHGFLWACLTSGRPIAYATPRLRQCSWIRMRNEDGSLDEPEAIETSDAYELVRQGLAVIEGPAKAKVTVCGVDSVTKQWRRYPLTGGTALNNNTQGGCRDIMMDGLLRVDAANFDIVMSVYDEGVAEMPIEDTKLDEFIRLLCILEPCYPGLPISASGFTAKRYRKD